MWANDLFNKVFRKKRLIDDLNQSIINQSITTKPETDQSTALEQPIQLEKESLQLGIAAGYTGRAIHDIMRTLERIELNLPSKDWFSVKLEELLKQHDENEEKRFENLQNLINSLLKTAETVPGPARIELVSKIKAIKDALERPRIQELINIIKETQEISYVDLSAKMEITQDAIRGMVSIIANKMPEIERFEKEKKGWVRFKPLNQS